MFKFIRICFGYVTVDRDWGYVTFQSDGSAAVVANILDVNTLHRFLIVTKPFSKNYPVLEFGRGSSTRTRSRSTPSGVTTPVRFSSPTTARPCPRSMTGSTPMPTGSRSAPHRRCACGLCDTRHTLKHSKAGRSLRPTTEGREAGFTSRPSPTPTTKS